VAVAKLVDPVAGSATDRGYGAFNEPSGRVEAESGDVVEAGTTATTHMPHRLCRVLAGRSRSQPVRYLRNCLLQAVIPGRSRLWPVAPYRPVTPEVAGSSPVAPAKSPANLHFLLPARRKTTAGFVSSRAHPAPEIAAQSRLKPVIPGGRTTGHIAGRPPEAGCRCSHLQRFRLTRRARSACIPRRGTDAHLNRSSERPASEAR
jgi:hypothetical protein